LRIWSQRSANSISPASAILHDGRQEGVQQGESIILRRLIQKRFGKLPAWADEQLAKSTTTELEELGLRLLDAKTIKELFGVRR
jgi:Domain of unknown function (DUF4351)